MTELVAAHDIPDLSVHPDAIRSAADDLLQAGRELDGSANALEGTWVGVPGVLSSAQTEPLMSRMALAASAGNEAQDGMRRASFALGDLADALAVAKARVTALEYEVPALRSQVFTFRQSMAELYEMSVSDMGEVWGPGQFEANSRLWSECLSVGDLIEAATSDCVGALQRIGDVDSLLSHTMSAFRHPSPGPRTSVAKADFEAAVVMSFLRQLAASDDPDAVRAWLEEHPEIAELLWFYPPPAGQVQEWWSHLEPDAARMLIEHAPRIVGNLDGVILADRIEANTYGVREEIARLESEISMWEEDIRSLERAESDEPSTQAVTPGPREGLIWRNRDSIGKNAELIDYYESLLGQQVTSFDANGDASTLTGVSLAVFDPAHDAIATYRGPIDPLTGNVPAWITHIAVSVPGTGSTMQHFADDRAADIYQEANVSAGEPTAVIQWAGGALPQNIPQAMDPSYSHALAPHLAAFVNALEVPPGADVTVIGHSYGGATVGLAEQAGLRADRILYMAAAGMGDGVHGVTDFPATGDVPHFAMMVRNDSVVGLIQGNEGDLLAIHGQTPLNASGVIRLETGQVEYGNTQSEDLENHWDGSTPPGFAGHSGIYAPGSTAFNNLVQVIVGGQVEVYAPSEVITYPEGTRVVVDGNDAPGYAPHYIAVDG
ncbi:alpha/beta hydrolase [Demequina sp.]|uniref:alpha/beta hydrolase n=1 Tax=Demequina sp. TaxID=2050685 RepID=UPI0025BF5FCC|nr:alpha/beta hydrolase [Demequina sp.]